MSKENTGHYHFYTLAVSSHMTVPMSEPRCIRGKKEGEVLARAWAQYQAALHQTLPRIDTSQERSVEVTEEETDTKLVITVTSNTDNKMIGTLEYTDQPYPDERQLAVIQGLQGLSSLLGLDIDDDDDDIGPGYIPMRNPNPDVMH